MYYLLRIFFYLIKLFYNILQFLHPWCCIWVSSKVLAVNPWFAYYSERVSCCTRLCFPYTFWVASSFLCICPRSFALPCLYWRTCRDVVLVWCRVSFAFRERLCPGTLLILRFWYRPPGKVCCTRVCETSRSHEALKPLFWVGDSNTLCIFFRYGVMIFWRLCLLDSSLFLLSYDEKKNIFVKFVFLCVLLKVCYERQTSKHPIIPIIPYRRLET